MPLEAFSTLLDNWPTLAASLKLALVPGTTWGPLTPMGSAASLSCARSAAMRTRNHTPPSVLPPLPPGSASLGRPLFGCASKFPHHQLYRTWSSAMLARQRSPVCSSPQLSAVMEIQRAPTTRSHAATAEKCGSLAAVLAPFETRLKRGPTAINLDGRPVWPRWREEKPPQTGSWRCWAETPAAGFSGLRRSAGGALRWSTFKASSRQFVRQAGESTGPCLSPLKVLNRPDEMKQQSGTPARGL